jgi:hypothetical protein
MKYPMIALSLGLMGAALLASPARGQRHGGPVFAHAGRHSTGFSSGTAFRSRSSASGGRFVRMRHGRAFARSGFGLNYYPYYFSDYYPEYDPQQSADVPPAPFRPPAAAPEAPASPPKSPESLVMELRGDHWIRLTSYGPMEIAGESGPPQAGRLGSPAEAKALVPFSHAPVPSELPHAVLVFRDGHSEEAAKYTIVGSTIWIKTDYWSTGSWMRRIPIADLNLAATLEANQQRGAKFTLPSRPSEVIVR